MGSVLNSDVYYWVIDGEVSHGTVEDFVRDLEISYYSGFSIDASRVWRIDVSDDGIPVFVPVTVRQYDEGRSEYDYHYYRVDIEGNEATEKIDLRA